MSNCSTRLLFNDEAFASDSLAYGLRFLYEKWLLPILSGSSAAHVDRPLLGGCPWPVEIRSPGQICVDRHITLSNAYLSNELATGCLKQVKSPLIDKDPLGLGLDQICAMTRKP